MNTRYIVAPIFGITLGLIVFGLTSFQAKANNYTFKVKLKNLTGQEFRLHSVQWYASGNNNSKDSDISIWMEPGETKTLTCAARANVKKWKRKFRVGGQCPVDGRLVHNSPFYVYFPLNTQWFARDWASKRKNTYTINLKSDNFRC